MNKIKLTKFAIILTAIGMIAFTSCEKDESDISSDVISSGSISSSIKKFSSIEEYTQEINKVDNMTYDELCKYERSNNFYSYGRKADEIYFQANPNNFKSEEDFYQFVKINSEYIELITDSNDELSLETKSNLNPDRYFANSEGMFEISGTMCKVIDEITVYTDKANIDELKIININNYRKYAKNDSFRFSFGEENMNKATTYEHREDDATTGSNRTKIEHTVHYVNVSDPNNPLGPFYDTYLRSYYIIRPYHRIWPVWYYCTRTLTGDIDSKVLQQYGNNTWAGHLHDESLNSGSPVSKLTRTWIKWLDNGDDGGGYTTVSTLLMEWIYFWGQSPDTDKAEINHHI